MAERLGELMKPPDARPPMAGHHARMTDQPMENLYATQHLAAQLANHPDRPLAEAVVEACGNLESLIRNQPDDHPIINAGQLEQLPITKTFVNMLENAMPNYIVRSDAAIATAAASIVAIKALEARIHSLEERLASG